MAQPQIVEGSQVSTPVNGVPLDSNAFRQAALAPGKLGAAIGQDVGGLFEDVSQKIQANRNFRTVADADLQMRKAHDDFTASLVTRPDERTWLPAWQEQVESTKDRILNGPDVGPDVKRQLTAQVDNWGAATSAAVRMKALDKGVQESYNTAIEASTLAYGSGGPTAIQDGDNVIKAGVANYAMSPAKGQLLMTKGRQIALKAQANEAINSDPIHAPDVLEKDLKDKMLPAQYRPAYREALQAQSRQQRLNASGIAEQVDVTHSYDPDLLKQQVAEKFITQFGADQINARVARYGKEQKAQDLKAERDNYNVAMMRADDHDWVNDREPEKFAQDVASDGLGWTQPSLRRSLDEHIQSKMKAATSQGSTGERPVEQQIFEQMKQYRQQQGVSVPLTNEVTEGKTHNSKLGLMVGIMGSDKKDPDTVAHNVVPGGLGALTNPANPNYLSDEQIQEKFGKGVTREQVLNAEKDHHAEVYIGMKQWFADPANKNATYADAKAHLIELQKPAVMGAVTTSLKPNTNVQATPGKRVRQNGVTYEFDGKDWTPVK